MIAAAARVVAAGVADEDAADGADGATMRTPSVRTAAASAPELDRRR